MAYDPGREIESILNLEASAGAIEKQARRFREFAAKRWLELAERIENGETTGDRIKDFVLKKYGFYCKAIWEFYRDLEIRVGQHVGEFVLFKNTNTAKQHLSKEESAWGRWFRLGVLKERNLLLDSPEERVYFPTVNNIFFVSFRMTPIQTKLKVEDKHLDLSIYSVLDKLAKLGADVPTCSENIDESLDFEILLGDQEVITHFNNSQKGDLKRFKEAAALLGRPQI